MKRAWAGLVLGFSMIALVTHARDVGEGPPDVVAFSRLALEDRGGGRGERGDGGSAGSPAAGAVVVAAVAAHDAPWWW